MIYGVYQRLRPFGSERELMSKVNEPKSTVIFYLLAGKAGRMIHLPWPMLGIF